MLQLSPWKYFALILLLSTAAISDVLPQNARLKVENGHLTLQSGRGRNINLNTQGSGAVVVNGIDVSHSYSLIESVRPQLLTLNTSSLGFLIRNLSQVVQEVSSEAKLAETLSDLRSSVSVSTERVSHLQTSYQTFQDQMSTLSRNVSRLSRQFITPEQEKMIQNMTNAASIIQNNLGTSSTTSSLHNVRQRVTSLESQVTELSFLEDRVTALEMSPGSGSSSGNFSSGTGGTGASSSSVIRSLRRKMRILRRILTTIRRRVYMDNCLSGPCHHGGTCIDTTTSTGFVCLCPKGFEGIVCNEDVNECAEYIGTDLGCQNGATCRNTIGSYTCSCPSGWFGIHCSQRSESCSSASDSEICGHGTCISTPKGGHPYTCLCDQGWTNSPTRPACIIDVNECLSNKPPCSHDPPVQCINSLGSFFCGACPVGYEGNGFVCRDIDECVTNNGGCSLVPRVECINTRPGRRCGPCPPGFSGDGITCSFVTRPCLLNPCHPLATCSDNPMMSSTFFSCTCPPGYIGNGMGPGGCSPSNPGITVGPNSNPCSSSPCIHGQCVSTYGQYRCICIRGFTGPTCASPVNWCSSSPCLNGGTCSSTLNSFNCVCPSSHTGNICQTLNTRCGGRLTGHGGMITYPSPSQLNYNHNVSCAWVISVNRSLVINATFSSFHLEDRSSHDCTYDWLQIHDGPRSSSHLIGRYCGRELPGVNGTVVSTHNHLYLWFRSDHNNARTGFSFTWNATEPVCGGDIRNQEHGAINSPGYPGRYPASRDCYWTVRVRRGNKIQFAFAALHIENHPNCSYDYLAIRDGLTENGHVLAKYCSSQTPSPVISSTSEAFVHFHSDHSLSDTGFHITFVSVPGIPGCGGMLTSDEGEFSAPTLSDLYHHNLECEWVIRVPSGERIELNFTSFLLESSRGCRFDFVEIREGQSSDSPMIGRFCGDDLPPTIESNSNFLFVRFKTDNSVTHEGFTARYRVLCGGEYSSPTGVIESPYHPNNYPHNRVCTFIIRQPPGKAISLNFTSFDLEGSVYHTACYFDYLEIRDGVRDTAPLVGRFCGPGHRAPQLYVSSLNGLFLRFKTDGSVSNKGFSAFYTTVDIRCGGIFHSLTGTINSPNNPDLYPGNTDCAYVIDVPEEYVIQLTWHTFSLESHFSCNFDYVEVFDNSSFSSSSSGVGRESNVMGRRYCGTRIPAVMTSHGNVMTIHFHSDSSLNHDGFSASYHALHASRVCGGNYHSNTGRIQTPNFPGNYPPSRSCSWVITAFEGRQIRLNFTSFDLEGSEPDCHDYLEIRNGNTDSSPLLRKICGQNRTDVGEIISHSHTLFLKFVSDYSVSGKGFEVFWDQETTGCGGTLTTPTGELMSPGYPEPFYRRVSCGWTVRVNAGSRIAFHFIDLDMTSDQSCLDTFVEVRNGPKITSPLLGRYCNEQGLISFNSSSNAIRIKMRTGWTGAGRGFRARYHSVCTGVLRGPTGVIESPNFPRPYPHVRNCTWSIKAPLGNAVNISFSHFDIEGSELGSTVCEYDFLEVRVGRQQPSNSPMTVKGRYCGNRVPTALSSGPGFDLMQIQFVSDHSVALNGFRLEWTVSGCGGVLRDFRGTFQSPNFPNAYPVNTECEWHIIAYPGLRINITIEEFDIESSQSATECTWDALKVYGGEDKTSPVLLTLCHHEKASKTVTSQGSNALVTLVSDGSVRGRGFRASYNFIVGGCGGYYTATKGEIHSPSYPEKYDHHSDCVWYLSTDENHVVELTFKDFDVEPAANCSYDYVAIYDGQNTDAVKIFFHCGSSLPDPPVIRSSGRFMTVRLKADLSSSGRGFKAEYRRACGATIVIDESSQNRALTSPNYPGMITPNTVCTWHLVAQEGSKIQLRFTHLNIRNNPSSGAPSNGSCLLNYVKIQDGDNTAPEMGRYCGTHRPRAIFSSSEQVTVRLQTKLVDGTGFRMLYSSVGTSCGGEIHSLSGEFASPGYPDYYPTSFECVWTIHAGPGNRIQMNFEAFDIEESDGCNLDYLEVHEGSPEGRLMAHNCSSVTPPPITANEALWVKFKTDAEGTATGFLVNFFVLQMNELSEPSSVITSPLYPHFITTSTTYEWVIRVENRQYISFEIQDLSIELNSVEDVCYSSLVFHDGHDDSSPVLATVCGYNAPTDPIVTWGNVALVRFVSRFRHEGSFFKLRYEAVTERPTRTGIRERGDDEAHPGCSFVVQLTANDSAVIKSPNYPQNYNNSLNCEWTIETVPHSRVSLLMTFQLEESSSCVFDKIEIFDGMNGKPNWRKEASICKRSDTPFSFISTGSVMKVRFITDSSVSRKGFYGVLRKVCGGTLTEPDGVIHTDNYPLDYPGGTCVWRIQVKNWHTIQMQFDDFSISNQSVSCGDDSLLIYNGGSRSSPFLGQGRYCGTRITPTIPETASNQALLVFKANHVNNARGFHLTYHEVSNGCGGHHRITSEVTSIEIETPNYPNPPHPHSECIWVISGPPTKPLLLEFIDTFDVNSNGPDCLDAYVEFRNGGTELSKSLGRNCGNHMPNPIQTEGHIMYIRYYTNTAKVHTGFRAKITAAKCGGTYRVVGGYLSSPNYPDPYDDNINCTWHIIGAYGHYLVFTFVEMNIYNPSSNCSTSEAGKLTIIDPVANRSSIYCSEGVPPPKWETASNNATIHFSNSMSSTGGHVNRFRLTVRASLEVCGGRFSGLSGTIQSPGYPHGLTHIWGCEWKIRGPPGSKVTLTFTDLDLPSLPNGLCLAYIRVYNGFSMRSPTLSRRICGNELPIAVNSSMNEMRIVLHSFRPSLSRGFRASWSAEHEQDCGGVVSAGSGIISSPGFENGGYEHSIYCVWIINNDQPTNSSLSIALQNLHLESNCFDYVVVEGLYTSGSTVFEREICHGEETVDFVLPFPTVRVSFISDHSLNATGFQLRYELSECGGFHTGPQTSFSSPGFQTGQYPSNSKCSWLFAYPEGSQVEVEFLSFELENSLNHDYVKIFNGRSEDSPLLGHFTGHGPPSGEAVGPSMSSNLLALFRSDGSTSRRGFNAIARQKERGCGGVFHGIAGSLSTRGFEEGQNYSPNVECIWEIYTQPGHQLFLSFIESFDVETSTDCSNDYVQISVKVMSSSNSTTWRAGNRRCGKQIPPPFVSNSSIVRLTFRTNGAVEGKGFKVSYTSKCGGTYREKEGLIMSPNYPDVYPVRSSCLYRIEAPPESLVTLDFISFSVMDGFQGCTFDYLLVQEMVYGRLRTRSKLCGKEKPTTGVYKGSVLLNFTSTYWSHPENTGFLIKYSIKECGGNISKPGAISLPTALVALETLSCIWDVTAPRGKIVHIKFQALKLRTSWRCSARNSLGIFDGHSSLEDDLIVALCGDHTEDLPTITTPSASARLRLRIPPFSVPVLKAAIQFSYKCGGNVNLSNADSSQVIRSLDADSDGNYESSLWCKWLVQGHRDMVISLNFTRINIEGPLANDTEKCPYDYVQVFDGPSVKSESLGVFCGSTPPVEVTSTRNIILVVFSSDSINQAPGMTATLKNTPRVCGASLLVATETLQSLESPNFPGDYPISLRCRWVITAPKRKFIRIHIDELNLENSLKCAKDRLTISNLPEEEISSKFISGQDGRVRYSSTARIGGKLAHFFYSDSIKNDYCGSQPAQLLTSWNNRIEVIFRSDERTTASGFRLHYSLATCNGTYSTDSGVLTSGGKGTCVITITSSANKFLSLFVDYLSFKHSPNIQNSFLVYDGPSSQSPLIANVTGITRSFSSWIPISPIYASGNSLHIQISTASTNWLRYNLKYFASEARNGCGAEVFGTRVKLYSPNYPQSPASNLTCLYTATVPQNYHAAADFRILDFESGGGCNSTYLELYDILPTNEARLFTTICPDDEQITRHLSPSNRLAFRFVTGPEQVNGTGWRIHVYPMVPHSNTTFEDRLSTTTTSP